MGLPVGAPGAQTGPLPPGQRRELVAVDGAVDRLVRQMAFSLVRKGGRQGPGDLGGAPVLGQPRDDPRAQLWVGLDLEPMVAPPALPGELFGGEGLLGGESAAVAAHFAGDR